MLTKIIYAMIYWNCLESHLYFWRVSVKIASFLDKLTRQINQIISFHMY